MRQRTLDVSIHDVDFDDDESIVHYVESQDATYTERREPFERAWYLQIANFSGKQYLQWLPRERTLGLPMASPGRVRITVNILMNPVRQRMRLTLQQRPRWTVIPATEDQDDLVRADLGSDVLRHLWREMRMDRALIKTLTYRDVLSNVFLRSYWDPFRGDSLSFSSEDASGYVPRNQSERKNADKDGREWLESQFGIKLEKGAKLNLFTGGPVVEVVSPFDVDPDRSARDWDDCEAVTQSKIRHISYYKERYQTDPETLRPFTLGSDDRTDWRRRVEDLGPALSTYQSHARSRVKRAENSVVERTVYRRPTQSIPEGWWATVVGKTVVAKRKNPVGCPTFPWEMVRDIEVPGQFWGTSNLEQAIPLQHALNRTYSQFIEHGNVAMHPPIFAPEGSGISEGSFTGEPNEIITYRYGLRPEFPPAREFSQSVILATSKLEARFEDITGQHEASRGESPGRVDSASGIANLKESDEGLLLPTNMELQDSLSRIGSAVLSYAAKYTSEERLVKIIGEDRSYDTVYFKGDDLVGDRQGQPGINYFNVTIELSSSLPSSRAGRQELGVQLVSSKILDPETSPADKAKVLEIMDIAPSVGALTSHRLEAMRIRRENRELMEGGLPEIWPSDDDPFHVVGHRDMERTPRYQKLVRETGGKSSPIFLATQAHIRAHVERMQAISEQTGGTVPTLRPQGDGTEEALS